MTLLKSELLYAFEKNMTRGEKNPGFSAAIET
jgi:hypothetical protein